MKAEQVNSPVSRIKIATYQHAIIDSPAPPSPVVSDEVIQNYKNTIEEQLNQIKSLESKVSELEVSLQTLVIQAHKYETWAVI